MLTSRFRLILYSHLTVNRLSNLVFTDYKKHISHGNVFNKKTMILINITSKYATLTAFTHDQNSASSNFESTSGDSINYLKRHLKCSTTEASVLVHKHHEFISQNKKEIIDRILLLENNGININTVKDNFWLLLNNLGEIKSKLELLEKWKFTNINNGASILRIPYLRLVKYTKQTEVEFHFTGGINRITYFATLAQCEEKRACEVFAKYLFMMRIKLTHMKDVLEMALSQGVLIDELLQDLWLFNYSTQYISNRIAYLEKIRAKEKCLVIKPWMLRCTDSVLNRFFELKEENIAALGSYSNLEDLLMNELGLTESEVSGMIAKHQSLSNISYSKAKEMIDFLKMEGFDAKMICNVPRVLCHKQATLKDRLTELRMVAPHLATLHNICRNKKDFIAFLKKCPPPNKLEESTNYLKFVVLVSLLRPLFSLIACLKVLSKHVIFFETTD